MRLLVVGSGAREHALCWRLSRDPDVTRVLCAPGNAGIARSFPVAAVEPADPEALLSLAGRERIDLTIIGPEVPLARGVADRFAVAGRPLFGPTAAAAQLETSKAFAKEFMQRHAIPTARYRVCRGLDAALKVIDTQELGAQLVVKADGLAAGKGVVVCDDADGARAAVHSALVEGAFGDAGRTVVLEERLQGPEVSFFVVADRDQAVPLVPAQDHKRIFDHDLGPNTGGMGAFAPSPLVGQELKERILAEIVRPVLTGMAAEGRPFRGVLYCGLMLTDDGPKVIEFNVRFGDPEAQVVLPMIDEPLAPLLWAAATSSLRSRACQTGRAPYVGVVMAAGGYPGDPRLGAPIAGLDRVASECPDVLVFCAGVRAGANEDLIVAGGRVLTIVGTGATFDAAIARAYAAVGLVQFDGLQYRRDIGRKAMRR